MAVLEPGRRVSRVLSKFVRYVRLYGLGRTVFKVAGRTRRLRLPGSWLPDKTAADVAMIGCGQFAFATIGYFLHRRRRRPFAACFDPAAHAAATFARFYGIESPARSASEAIAHPDVRYVYVASNHATHTSYAVEALAANKTVYVEKPVAVSQRQLAELSAAVAAAGPGRIYAGYNRPFSRAVRDLRGICRDQRGPLTLNCFISGHLLGSDHWYRRPEEGTRICGNVGHWLDLAVHMLSWHALPDAWRIDLAWSDAAARDDDMAISLTSERGDLVVIVLTARSEPFEGINETINVQWGEVIAKIDDFRRMEVWQGERRFLRSYWPKDVGHGAAIVQPFGSPQRAWSEVELSTLLMLRITDMVRGSEKSAQFSFQAEAERLETMKIANDLSKSVRHVERQ